MSSAARRAERSFILKGWYNGKMEEYNEMINIVLHGLGQNPSSWVNVSDCAKGIELHIPDLFKIVSGAINYDQ